MHSMLSLLSSAVLAALVYGLSFPGVVWVKLFRPPP